MTISSKDIVLFQSQDNTDNDSGGGSRTASVITDGAVNNLFPDISRIDTVAGRVNLRKVFPTITTDNRDVYYGAHSIIRKAPTDPKVSALLFYTDDPHDTRIEAQDKIESYVVASYVADFWLYGNHVAGARSLTFLQLVETQIPDVGSVYLVSEGVQEQYIRVTALDIQEIPINYSSGGGNVIYTRKRVIVTIDQPLEFPFQGSPFHPSGYVAGNAQTWETQVADAANFHATKSLATSSLIGDLTIKVDSIFEQLVPATKSQTPLVNKNAMVQGVSLTPSGNMETFNTAGLYSANQIVTAPTPITPTTLVFSSYLNRVDDGNGNIVDVNASNKVVGFIDYKQGFFAFNLSSYVYVATYESAMVTDSNIQFTDKIKITTENSGYVFVRNLSPAPSIGDFYVEYRSQGKWYKISATGNRVGTQESIGQDPSIGAGTLSILAGGTATVNITLASLPDLDSSVIFSWGSDQKLNNRAEFINTNTKSFMEIELGQTNIDPTSFVMLMPTLGGGVTNATVTSDVNGLLIDTYTNASQKIIGRLDFINGKVTVTDAGYNRLDNAAGPENVIIDFNYSNAGAGDVGEIKTVVASRTATVDQITFGAEDYTAGSLIVDLTESVLVNSIRMELTLIVPFSPHTQTVALTSNATGDLIRSGTSEIYGNVSASGVITFNFPDLTYTRTVGSYLGFGSTSRYGSATAKLRVSDVLDDIIIKYQTAVDASPSLTHNITDKIENIAKYLIHTLPNITGEVSFGYPSATYKHYSKEGLIFTENGTQVGTIDYLKGVIEKAYIYRPLANFNVAFTTLFTDDVGSTDTIQAYTFRTAASKLTTSSFQLRYESENGFQSATSDANGVITGVDIDTAESYVDTLTGMAHILFTAQVKPDSLFYDAVAETSLPLDPELLGLNPVRLPADGRVPVFKVGRFLVIFNEVTTPVINAGVPVVDQVNTLARSGQAYIEVIDVDGKRLDPDQYVADRTNGTVTFTNPLSLVDKYGAALTSPFSIVDRVEDMVLATDVQINGLISLSSALTHNYDAITTKVASTLVWGDTGARIYNLFSQEIWSAGSPVWSNERIGDNTTAQYNNVNYPIQIDNKSSSAGRWAVIFTNSTTVKVVNEKTGEVITSVSVNQTTGEDVAPINPATLLPYFTIPLLGFGTGWVTNNVIRFNTDSGDNNMWVIRTIQAGALSELTDSIDVEIRGDAN